MMVKPADANIDLLGIQYLAPVDDEFFNIREDLPAFHRWTGPQPLHDFKKKKNPGVDGESSVPRGTGVKFSWRITGH